MQRFGRIKLVGMVAAIVGGMYFYADWMRDSGDDSERRIYFPAAVVAAPPADALASAGDDEAEAQATAPDTVEEGETLY